jgi:membrane complex biogenesis BtpA family protein
MRSTLNFLSTARPAFIAMIHVGALPGTPRNEKSVTQLAAHAVEEAKLLTECGADAIIMENMHDVPYLNREVGPEIVASMTAIALAVRRATQLPLGIQVLAGANKEALAVAQAADCQFIRAEGFVFAHVADEGLMPQADAGPLLRFRKAIGAENIAILADIKKKHSAHAITSDVDLAETAHAAEFFGADGVIVTGAATGRPASPADVDAVRKAVKIPVLVGSGVTPDNAREFSTAHGVIVGSYLKRDGHWANGPDRSRIKAMRDAVLASCRTISQ